MTDAHVSDPAELVRQLSVDQVAFAGLPDDPALQDQLAAVVDDSTGMIVAPAGEATPADLRDLAQDVLDTSALHTVVVRSPESVAAVSDLHSRAELEVAQTRMLAEPDYVAGLSEFQGAVGFLDVPWLTLAAVAVVALLTVIAWTIQSVRSGTLTQS